MKHIIFFLSFISILLLETTPGRCLDQITEAPLYQKSIVSNGVIYVADGIGSPPEFTMSLVMKSIGDDTEARKVSLYENLPKTYTHYPYRWDISGQYFFSIGIEPGHPGPAPYFMRIPFIELESLVFKSSNNSTPYRISGMGPLVLALSSVFRFIEYFDFVALDEHTFQVYLSERGKLSVWQTTDIMSRETVWGELIGEYVIDFTGPFHAVRIDRTTYIFSEHTGNVYVPDADRLNIVGHLPSEVSIQQNDPLSRKFLIVDKDQEAIFTYEIDRQLSPLLFSPTRQHIAAGADAVRDQDIVHALRSALAVYGWLPEEPGAP